MTTSTYRCCTTTKHWTLSPRRLLVSPLTSVHVLIRKQVTSNRHVYLRRWQTCILCSVKLAVIQGLLKDSTIRGFLIGDTPVGKHLQSSTIACGNGEFMTANKLDIGRKRLVRTVDFEGDVLEMFGDVLEQWSVLAFAPSAMLCKSPTTPSGKLYMNNNYIPTIHRRCRQWAHLTSRFV